MAKKLIWARMMASLESGASYFPSFLVLSYIPCMITAELDTTSLKLHPLQIVFWRVRLGRSIPTLFAVSPALPPQQ